MRRLLMLLVAGVALAQPSPAPEAAPSPATPEAETPAGEQGEGAMPTSTEVADPTDPATEDALDSERPLDRSTQIRIFKQARRRKEEVERLEGQLRRERMRLEAMQKDVVARYKALRMLQEEMEALARSNDEEPKGEEAERLRVEQEAARAKRVGKLAQSVNKMKAEEAAKMLESMDKQLVVEVLLKLKDRQAGKILGALEPKLAARLSEMMTDVKKKKRK